MFAGTSTDGLAVSMLGPNAEDVVCNGEGLDDIRGNLNSTIDGFFLFSRVAYDIDLPVRFWGVC
jgi:hypothetical protein